jgi:hypothetical protein
MNADSIEMVEVRSLGIRAAFYKESSLVSGLA